MYMYVHVWGAHTYMIAPYAYDFMNQLIYGI